ncbi:hypothetical protein ACQP2X_43660 [Actinoplanes sp. CA-131856]
MNVARPPRAWELQTAAVMAAIGAAALLGMILVATDLSVRAAVLSDGASGMSPLVSSVVSNAAAFHLLYLLLLFGYLGGFYWWRNRSREMLRRVGDIEGAATIHWAVYAWSGSLALSFIVSVNLGAPRDDEPAAALARHALLAGIRVLGLALLLFGVWQIREQIHRSVAASGVNFRIADLGPRAAANPLPLPALTVTETTGLPVADDDFWDRVRRLAAGAGTDLAMLETTEGVARRWTLIPPGSDLATIRAGVAPGAVLTVYPTPPAQAETEGFTPTEADEYYGFLEDAASGSLWYQTVRPNRIPAFLARTRSARRWALYPATSPTALTAITPEPAPAAPTPDA